MFLPRLQMDPKLIQCLHRGHSDGDADDNAFVEGNMNSLFIKILEMDIPQIQNYQMFMSLILSFCQVASPSCPLGQCRPFGGPSQWGRVGVCASTIPQIMHYHYASKYKIQKLSSIWSLSGTSTHATHGVEAQFTLQPQPSPRCVFEFLSRFSHRVA